ncbi:MAG: amidohydrolase family protein [Armatimonadetes bacterium]|nr:amidohydrolase family protein [Armatimonadota bacterium]
MVTLIRGGWVVAHDGRRHRVIPDGEVAFDKDEILYAGPKWDGTAEAVIEAPEALVSPGFINMHAHIGVELMAPFIDVQRARRYAPSLEFVQNLELPPSLTAEEQRISGAFSLVQMLRCGATTIVDAAGSGPIWWLGNPPGDEEMLLESAEQIGARIYASLSYRSGRVYRHFDGTPDWHFDEESGLEGLRRAVDFAVRHRGTRGGHVETMLCPHAVDNCTPALLDATKRAAQEWDLRVQIHCAQYTHEVKLIQDKYGCTPVQHLANNNFLGPEIILGHTIYTSGHRFVGGDPNADLQLIADSGASVAHSPLPFARAGEAMQSFARYRAAGINMSIGCDIWPADIIAEMRLTYYLSKTQDASAETPTCQEVFDAATLGGAHALGRTDLGRLAPGAKADIVLVDLGGYHLGQVIDPIRALITCATGQDVRDVWVEGRHVVVNRRVVGADEEALRIGAKGVYKSLIAASRSRDAAGMSPEEILGLEYTPPLLS